VPLPLPSLDTRSWDELVDESRALIPQHGPLWTDHNVHDPGITLMELLAWLAELELFQLDRISPARMRSFLRLAGVEPRPATVAETVVALRQAAGSPNPVQLPRGFQVSDERREIVFESPRPLTVSPAWLELSSDEGTTPRRGQVMVESSGARDDQTDALLDPERTVAPFGPAPRAGDALWLGFTERPAQPGEEFSMYFWSPDWREDRALRRRIAAERTARERDCGVPPYDQSRGHYSARTAWEYRSGAGSWQPLEVVADRTRALTLSGRVVIRGPSVQQPDPQGGRHWIRCRLVSGRFDCPPRLERIAVNAVRVRHAATMGAPEGLGVSRGTARQVFSLASRPVVAGSTRIEVGGDRGWDEVLEWDRASPSDEHYRLDPEAGTIEFGDGLRGRVPADQAKVVAVSYAVGGGAAGNIPARRLNRLVGAGALIAVVQPDPAIGGAAAESLSQAHGRALRRLERADRGVTTEDVEALARHTPGVPIGRVRALPGHHPAFGCIPAAGVVTVVVLPRCGDTPRPSAELLEHVRRYLERRRLVCTELHVVGPSYVPVTVSATLHAGPGAPSDLARRANGALETLFDPLTGGPDGNGWPFGRAVLESEVMAALNELPGVRFVDELGISGPEDTRPRCGNLPLCPTELVDSRTHHIRVKED
jgi:predicted phage baseplate assembly protein